ncbi:MAG TPA: DUF6569 family protein [Pyrinomonadaceae bacterium]|nr:DUF6569 family protein [Pyrinomonadaceae bacterium]
MSSSSFLKAGRLALLLGVLVSSLAVVTWTPAPSASAKAHGGGGGGGRRWRVGAPVSYKNLTLFPVTSFSAGAGAGDYVTLDEGIKNGTVVITERGSGVTARAMNRRVAARASDDGGTVNQLALVNKSGKKLLLLAGEVIVGGKQDRIVEADLIIPPVSVPVSLNVFCVEAGRWSHRAASHSGPVAAGRGEVSVSAPVQKFSTLGAVAHPKLRAAAQDKKDHGEVWKEVRENNVKLGTNNSTETYQEVYSNKEVESRLEDYVAELQKAGAGATVVGVVVARNGEFVWADAFASRELFARYWPKLLKSYVVDAIGDRTSERVPSIAQAEAYLHAQGGAHTVSGREGVYRLSKFESPAHAVFRLEDLSLPAPLLLHFNKMQRQ